VLELELGLELGRGYAIGTPSYLSKTPSILLIKIRMYYKSYIFL